MKSSMVVVDDGYRDSAALALHEVLRRHGQSELVELSSLLARFGYTFDSESGFLTSDGFAGAAARRGTPPSVFNRVVQISDETTRRLKNRPADAIPANFIRSAFASVLDTFPNCYGRPGMGSPVGHMLPLNLQWKAVNDTGLDVETPAFRFAFGAQEVDMSAFREPIVKSPFDIYSWRSNVLRVTELHTFVVEKPVGSPVMAYCIGDHVDAFHVRTGEAVTGPLERRLREVVPSLQDAFGAFLGETLFFADGARLTFAAFSHHLKTAADYSGFRDAMAFAVTRLRDADAKNAGEGGEVLA